MSITAKDVQALRQLTGVGMMDAKKALEATDGDMDAAVQYLRVHNKAAAAKRAGREAGEGAVAVVRNANVAAIVELRCETDFVAKSPEFVSLVEEIANELALNGEEAASQFSDRVENLAVILKENIALGRTVRFEAPEGAIIGSYLHLQNGRGVNAVLVEVTGADDALAHEIALHIAFARPEYLSRDDVPEDVVASERRIAEETSRAEGKPEQALPKIVEGRLNGFFKDAVLLEQPSVSDNKKTVKALLDEAGVTVTRFVRFEVGQA